MQEGVYYILIQDIADVRQKVMSTWAGFQLSMVDETVDQWQKDSVLVFVHKEVISNSCFDVFALCFHVFHDCIERVASVTFDTLLTAETSFANFTR